MKFWKTSCLTVLATSLIAISPAISQTREEQRQTGEEATTVDTPADDTAQTCQVIVPPGDYDADSFLEAVQAFWVDVDIENCGTGEVRHRQVGVVFNAIDANSDGRIGPEEIAGYGDILINGEPIDIE